MYVYEDDIADSILFHCHYLHHFHDYQVQIGINAGGG